MRHGREESIGGAHLAERRSRALEEQATMVPIQEMTFRALIIYYILTCLHPFVPIETVLCHVVLVQCATVAMQTVSINK